MPEFAQLRQNLLEFARICHEFAPEFAKLIPVLFGLTMPKPLAVLRSGLFPWELRTLVLSL